ncbi:hypothetical protein [Noviherbaspirillum sp.]|uniref:hypothetical protein n=1 Tax=Noviherbaspirillum sp. TaxID=1926288 RepID=UPI0025CF7339|nr:hypothetical protein [Noviherbaspirillum sp.]
MKAASPAAWFFARTISSSGPSFLAATAAVTFAEAFTEELISVPPLHAGRFEGLHPVDIAQGTHI